MKILSVIVTLFIFSHASGQGIAGEYYDYFGSTLQLKPDSTFKYTWRFDLASSWTTGEWRVQNDTIYLVAVPVYDTLKYRSLTDSVMFDKMVLSLDEKSESISADEAIMYLITSGGQNRREGPNKLFYRKGKLYEFGQDGDLIKRKQRGILTNKKFPPYYRKNEN